jgi:hypothetical protein
MNANEKEHVELWQDGDEWAVSICGPEGDELRYVVASLSKRRAAHLAAELATQRGTYWGIRDRFGQFERWNDPDNVLDVDEEARP